MPVINQAYKKNIWIVKLENCTVQIVLFIYLDFYSTLPAASNLGFRWEFLDLIILM